MQRNLALAASMITLTLTLTANAGDPPAHTAAMLLCGVAGAVPTFAQNPIVGLPEQVACAEWLKSTLAEVAGDEPQYWCDDAVVAPHPREDRHSVTLNDDMVLVAKLCGTMSFACMGLERTLRHHCHLNKPKTILCDGAADDHAAQIGTDGTRQYCEGEIHSPAGGQAFVAEARDASIPVFQEAMERWASVCKEPDDPCKPVQCDRWCKRTQPSYFSHPTAGYCVNDSPDPACILHECLCTTYVDCGTAGKPCCQPESRCEGGLFCDAKTGYCAAQGTQRMGGIAPIEDPPPCASDDGTTQGVCPRTSEDVALPAPGNLVSGRTLNFRLAPTVPVCNAWPNRDHWEPSTCYSGVRPFSLSDQCVYIDRRDGELKSASCSSIFYLDPEERGVSWPERVAYQSSRYSRGVASTPDHCNRSAGAFDTYVYGGDARDPLAKWSSRGRRALLCRVTYTGPTPDGLYGPTWIKAAGGLEIESDAEGGRSELVEVYLPVEGDMRELCEED